MAIQHHRTHNNKTITFDHHHCLKQIYADQSNDIRIIKSVQNGITEFLIVYLMTELMQGRKVFYAMPTFPLIQRVVTNRINKSIKYSQFYSEGARGNDNDRIMFKDLWDGSVSFAPATSDTYFTEFPADTYIVDEKNKCDQDTLKMGFDRLSHSDLKRTIFVGNPTITNFGIDIDYNESDQKLWNIKCGCGNQFNPDFYNHVVRQVDETVYLIRDQEYEPNTGKDINMICDKCERPIDRFSDGRHIPLYPKRSISGYRLSKLFSGTNTMEEIVKDFNEALSNDYMMQLFQNNTLGMSYTAAGAKISKDMLDSCIDQYVMPESFQEPCIMGVDVGTIMNVVIARVLPDGIEKNVYIGEVRELVELFELIKRYNVVVGVIDGAPEGRISKLFANTFPGGFRCFVGGNERDTINTIDKLCHANRTQLLDSVKEKFVLKHKLLPMNAASIKNYYNHIQASTRVYVEDKQKYEWQEGSNPDHYLFAEAFLTMAHRILKMVRR